MRSGVKVGIVSAVAWALFDYASQHKERGSVIGFDTEMYAVYSGFDEIEIVAVIQAMTDKGVIVEGRLANWMKRQPQREDNSTERVRAWREMKRIETQSNTKKSPDTDTDTDTDNRLTDKDKEKPPAPKTGASKTDVTILEHLENVFAQARGTKPPDWSNPKAAQKTWRTPIRTMLNKHCGGDVALTEKMIQATVKKMMDDGLTFSMPAQILRTFESVVLNGGAEKSSLEGYTYAGR